MTSQLTVAARFRGPATSGNGGYTAGLLASLVPGGGEPGAAITVRLRTPPPLDTPMAVETRRGTTVARHGSTVVATAIPATVELSQVPPVAHEVAVTAAAGYAGLTEHPFPECFVCGTNRRPGDGLRVFPGRTDPGRTASPWRPDESVADSAGRVPLPVVWASLDCPGGWTAEMEGRPMVLGTMSARVDALPLVGEECVVTGALRTASGRFAETLTSLYGDGGRPLAHAYAIWVEIDAPAFNRFFAPAT